MPPSRKKFGETNKRVSFYGENCQPGSCEKPLRCNRKTKTCWDGKTNIIRGPPPKEYTVRSDLPSQAPQATAPPAPKQKPPQATQPQATQPQQAEEQITVKETEGHAAKINTQKGQFELMPLMQRYVIAQAMSQLLVANAVKIDLYNLNCKC